MHIRKRFVDRFKKGCHSREGGNPGSSFRDTFIEIHPRRVVPLYQFQRPCPFPFLYLFFPLERRLPRFMDFIPNQTVNIIFLGKTLHQIVLMLAYTFNKVGGYACIQRTILLAAKDIDVKLFQGLFLDSRLRGNDLITSL